MTTAISSTNGHTAARVQKLRKLIEALRMSEMRRDEIGALLELGPSGVRKYLVDLGARIQQNYQASGITVRLAMDGSEVEGYLAQLRVKAPARPIGLPRSALARAKRDPARHFHIMDDDEHYSVRVHTAPVVRDPLVSALFGVRSTEARV